MQNKSKEKDERLKEKDIEIKSLHKDVGSRNVHINDLQNELNDLKKKYYGLENIKNTEAQRLNHMLQQQDLQYHSTRGTEINQLNQCIQQIETERNAYFTQMQQKEQEIHTLQNTLTETVSVAEKNHERLIKEKEDEANNNHHRIMAKKNLEMLDVIQKYQDLEARFNQMEQNHKQQMD